MQVQSSETQVFNLLKLPGPLQGSGALIGTSAFTPHPWPPAKPPPRLQQPHGRGSGQLLGCKGVSRSSPNTDARKHGAAHLPTMAWASISGHNLPLIRCHLPPPGPARWC